MNSSTNYLHNKQELEYLHELMADFPVENPKTVDQAYNLLITRYSQLETNLRPFINLLKTVFNSEPISSLIKAIELPVGPSDLQALWLFLSKTLHGYLFDEILSNAGTFRQFTDPNNGIVGFGGMRHREINSFKFAGTPAQNIEKELFEAFAYLDKAEDPVANALEFYRRFVRIHPFYDANGRIARFIVTMYLAIHDKYIRWASLESEANKSKFIKKLNSCHTRSTATGTYDEYFMYLYNFFMQFVTDANEESTTIIEEPPQAP